MKAVRKQRLMLLVFVLCGVGIAIGLALTALQENINLYYSPAQMQSGEAPVGKRIRGGGLVVAGTVKRDPNSLLVHFDITDGEGMATVQYDGILPDLFREGQGVVALGELNKNGVFVASEVLAKHDENYMPPEVQDALDKAHPGGTPGYEKKEGGYSYPQATGEGS
ncbi:cytochrome c maturation protein CcmE [Parendozoicomonas haliclonae]|uniref:Cytochrome c-type biogenesis protein CcmE n=1 Tax=Parendozoicomonas haliclonae TaxID=1960125 RepID=A0A1X7AHX6_9GAMM|nr:cytochrome c maturation protein CcmE [Parendozoicomonas haliclonae]SMA41913.1 Cytochrome c-type biogenesis protein CcmE [Parendozoicomonas haliclonae]